MNPTEPLLEVRDLSVEFALAHGQLRAVRDVSFQIAKGQTVALVGESGSGKSVTARTILGLLDPPARVTRGEVVFEGQDLLALSRRDIRAIRGDAISLVLQDAMTSLNPVQTIGHQVAEGLRLHRGLSRKAAWARATGLLDDVGIRDAAARTHQYPHQLSGGMRQRVMVAQAVACHPRLLIADEPTTALDVTIQAQILDLISRLSSEQGTAVLLISHDLGIVADFADRVVVMYAGEVVEDGPVAQVLEEPRHPYTRGLIESLPSRAVRRARLGAIGGQLPDPLALPGGCLFEPRCPYAVDSCLITRPRTIAVTPGWVAACDVDLPAWSPPSQPSAPAVLLPGPDPSSLLSGDQERDSSDADASPLLEVIGLGRTFHGRGLFGSRRSHTVAAVQDVSFDLRPGETLGLVGESGSGKSTLARLIARLIEPTSGQIRFGGTDITHRSGDELRRLRRHIQIVFQDSLGSLDPRRRVRAAIREPLQAFGLDAGEERVAELLGLVGLSMDHARRAPHELSGGQRQRVAIARALAVHPQLLICDEPVASLDVSVQAQVMNLLADLQERLSMTYLFISHDLALVHQISDRILVMYQGNIVEAGSADEVFERPQHPYTQSLLAAVPGQRDRRDEPSDTAQVRCISA